SLRALLRARSSWVGRWIARTSSANGSSSRFRSNAAIRRRDSASASLGANRALIADTSCSENNLWPPIILSPRTGVYSTCGASDHGTGVVGGWYYPCNQREWYNTGIFLVSRLVRNRAATDHLTMTAPSTNQPAPPVAATVHIYRGLMDSASTWRTR